LLEKNWKLTEKTLQLLEQQEAQVAKLLNKSTPPITVECGSETTAAMVVSSLGPKANKNPKIINVVCCACDYHFFGEQVREPLDVFRVQCNLRCHKQCSYTDEEGHFCYLCGCKKPLGV
jgi:hypothetical protein